MSKFFSIVKSVVINAAFLAVSIAVSYAILLLLVTFSVITAGTTLYYFTVVLSSVVGIAITGAAYIALTTFFGSFFGGAKA